MRRLIRFLFAIALSQRIELANVLDIKKKKIAFETKALEKKDSVTTLSRTRPI